MKIGGLQRFSLLDYPKEMSAIVFTQGCNFRCPYCHNPRLVLAELFEEPISEAEVLSFLKERVGRLSAVVITGGEPTLHDDLPDFIHKIKELGFKIKLDTNGSRPEMLKRLIERRLIDYFAMDIKAPLEDYHTICRTEIDPELILRSMELIRESKVDYEFRSTVMPEILGDTGLVGMRALLKPGDRYYLQPCAYTTTLDDLEPISFNVQNWESSRQYQELKSWANEMHIALSLRG